MCKWGLWMFVEKQHWAFGMRYLFTTVLSFHKNIILKFSLMSLLSENSRFRLDNATQRDLTTSLKDQTKMTDNAYTAEGLRCVSNASLQIVNAHHIRRNFHPTSTPTYRNNGVNFRLRHWCVLSVCVGIQKGNVNVIL